MSSVTPSDGGYNYYQRNISDLEDDIKEDNKRVRKANEERAQDLEASYRQDLKKREEATQKTVDGIRENSNDQVSREKDNSRAELERAKKDTYDRFGRASREMEFEKQKAAEAIQQSREAYDNERKKDAIQREHNDSTQEAIFNKKMTEAVQGNRESHERETDELRAKISTLIDDERQKSNARAVAGANARRELEDEVRIRENSLQQGHAAELSNARSEADRAEKAFALKNDENLKSRDLFYAGLIGKMNQEQTDRQHDSEIEYQNALTQEQTLLKKQDEASNRQLEAIHTKEEATRADALETQARTNRTQLSRQKLSDQTEIDRLNNEIHERDLRGADGKGSATLEQRTYNNLSQKYEKTSQEQIARDQRRTDRLQENFHNQIDTLHQENRNQVSELTRQHSAEQTNDRNTFVSHAYETDQANKMALRNKDEDALRQGETIRRTYGNMLERQRRDYEEVLQQSREESNSKFNSYKQDTDFSSKMAQRNFNSQQTEMIRAYEKKLAEQKTNYDDQIDNLKTQIAQVTHNDERKEQRALEDQSRAYEQKIAQTEYQNKEHERIVSQNYEDQIEKIKRANALLIQKKS